MGGRTNARVDQSMSDTTSGRAHILRQIINQDKSALTPEEREGSGEARPSRPNVILASALSSALRNDFLPTSVSFSSPPLPLEERNVGCAVFFAVH